MVHKAKGSDDHEPIVYLSPHLDDVALSCGGHVSKQTSQGKSVLIVTVTAGDPPQVETSPLARTLHRRWDLSADVISTRRQEDIAACDRLGAAYIHLDLPDCIYRRHPVTYEPFYPSEESLFGPLNPTDGLLLERLVEKLAGLVQGSQILVPLGVGNHVDHQLTRQAAEQLLPSKHIIYYEEYPYVRQEGALKAALGSKIEWHPKVIPLDEPSIRARIEAIACYRSQLSSFFKDNNDLERQIRNYCKEVGGERLWLSA